MPEMHHSIILPTNNNLIVELLRPAGAIDSAEEELQQMGSSFHEANLIQELR